MVEKNELDLLIDIIETAQSAKKDTEKVLKGNKSAGIRVRRTMQDIRNLAKEIRALIQDRK